MISGIDIGFITIHFYSIAIFIAIIVGGEIAMMEAKKWGISKDYMFNMIFWMFLCGIVGARLYFVMFNLGYYLDNLSEIYKVWHGGLAIHGGIIFALLFLVFYAKRYKIKIVNLLDILAPGFLVAQAIGRWGNFFNGEAHGPATTLDYLQSMHLPDFIINGMCIDGIYYIPTFLYESMWCLLGFVLIIIIRNMKYCKEGEPLSFYLVWYGIGRFFIESLRTDSLMLMNFKVAQAVSILMVLLGIILFIIFKSGSRFSNLYNDGERVYDVKF